VARGRPGARAVHLRSGAPVRGWATPRRRHRRPDGDDRRRAGGRTGHVRRDGARERKECLDPHGRRVLRHAHASRHGRGREGRRRRGGRAGRDGRAERDAGARCSVRSPRRPRGRERRGLPRSARLPAAARAAAAARARRCATASRCACPGAGARAGSAGRRADAGSGHEPRPGRADTCACSGDDPRSGGAGACSCSAGRRARARRSAPGSGARAAGCGVAADGRPGRRTCRIETGRRAHAAAAERRGTGADADRRAARRRSGCAALFRSGAARVRRVERPAARRGRSQSDAAARCPRLDGGDSVRAARSVRDSPSRRQARPDARRGPRGSRQAAQLADAPGRASSHPRAGARGDRFNAADTREASSSLVARSRGFAASGIIAVCAST